MKNRLAVRRTSNSSGFTLIELMIVVAILGVLSSVVSLQMGAAISKARFTKVFADLDAIHKAAIQYYADYDRWAPDTWPGVTPEFVPEFLASWPSPPCPGWNYDWENWLSIYRSVRVTVRKRGSATLAGQPDDAIFYMCFDQNGISDCTAGEGGGVDITQLPAGSRFLTCTE